MTLLFRDASGPRRAPQPSVICIGAFDGVHLGHQHLLAEVRARARMHNAQAVALSFEPLPREFFHRGAAVARLSSARQKFELLRAAGMDAVGLLRFNQQLAATTATDFVEQLLVRRLRAVEVWIGPEFRFGHGRSGDLALLQALGGRYEFTAQTIATIAQDGERISSSRIRAALAAGDHRAAGELLGRDFSISGHVVHGLKLGRTLGYPTANLPLLGKLPPVHGVYAVRVTGAGLKDWPSVASLGTRPTIGGHELLLEAHLFDFDGDLYGQRLEVSFIAKLRDEAKFENLDAMVACIHQDAAAARTILAKPIIS